MTFKPNAARAIATTAAIVTAAVFALPTIATTDAQAQMVKLPKQIIIASLHGHPQPLVIEAARSSLIHANQPGFAEVFDGMRNK